MVTRGFTLVELAVVILIVGLLVGGIALGSTLVQQAELRTIISELDAYKAAYTTFKGRYKLPPGDFNIAQTIFAGDCAITISCNGDGNFAVNAYYGSSTNETAKAWKHLDRAKLIGYPITAIPASYAGVLNYDIAPKSKARDAGYYIASGGDIGGDFAAIASPFNGINATINALFIGRASSSGGFTVGAITAKEAFDIDRKVDDGIINAAGSAIGNNTGLIRTIEDQTASGNCITGSGYNVTTSGQVCLLSYKLDQ